MGQLILVLSVFLIAIFQNGKSLLLSEKKALISPPANIQFFAFGYQMPMADSLWIRAIQDFDYCEDLIAKNLCKGNGWLFSVLDAATNLAPDYEIIYHEGGLALTVLVSDYPGASKIFDKGVRVFPNNYTILYAAAYHALLEEKNNLKAADLLVRAGKNGGPDWTYSLAVGLYGKSGQKEVALKLFQELAKQNLDENLIARMRSKLEIPDQ